MSVNGSGEGFASAFKAWYDEKIRGVNEALQETAKSAADKGKDLMVEHINTRGIQKPGRVDTGHMRESVQGRSAQVSRDRALAEFGWIDERMDYFKFQELGFNHTGGGYIPGMYALSDAGELVMQDLRKEFEEKIDGI